MNGKNFIRQLENIYFTCKNKNVRPYITFSVDREVYPIKDISVHGEYLFIESTINNKKPERVFFDHPSNNVDMDLLMFMDKCKNSFVDKDFSIAICNPNDPKHFLSPVGIGVQFKNSCVESIIILSEPAYLSLGMHLSN